MEKKTKAKRSLASMHQYQKVFGTHEGKKVLWDLMKSGGILQSSRVPGDPYGTAFNEGARSIVLGILNKVKTNPEKLEKILESGGDYDKELWPDNEEG